MFDIKLSFTSGFTGVELTGSKSLDVLDFKSIVDVGKGTPLFINIFSDGAFTTGVEVGSFRVMTGTTSPGAAQIQEIGPIAASALAVAGLKAKVPLSAMNLLRFVSLAFYAQTALSANGHIKAFLSVD